MTTDRRLILGTLSFSRILDRDECIELLSAAHATGINAINTADTDYSGRSEIFVGEFLATLPAAERPWLLVELSGADMGVPHDPDLSPAYIRGACERSVRRLGVEPLDVVVLPRPSFRIPIEETLDGVNDKIIRAGLARAVAVSTFPAWLTCHAQHVARQRSMPPIAAELAPYNLLDRRVENEVLPNVAHWSMEFFGWAALAQGLLAGRYPVDEPYPSDSRAALLGGIYGARVSDNARHAASRFVTLAQDYGLEPTAAAIAWVLHQPLVTGAVVGPRRIEHIKALSPARNLRLSDDFLEAADSINPPGTATADFFNSAPWMKQKIG